MIPDVFEVVGAIERHKWFSPDDEPYQSGDALDVKPIAEAKFDELKVMIGSVAVQALAAQRRAAELLEQRTTQLKSELSAGIELINLDRLSTDESVLEAVAATNDKLKVADSLYRQLFNLTDDSLDMMQRATVSSLVDETIESTGPLD